MKRSAGILMPVFSLPGKYGIGNLGREAYKFVDFLHASGQSFWQVLPLESLTYGDSPYQSPSAFAKNPYFIDLDALFDEGLLSNEELREEASDWEQNKINYELLNKRRYPLLKKAFLRYKNREKILGFIRRNSWAKGYGLFQSIKDLKDGLPWTKWPEKIKKRDHKTIREYETKLQDEINFHIFLQIKFFEQWQRLKKYANARGVSIIGDIPIYLALDSADVWENQSLFRLYADGNPRLVAGTPPDYFSKTGQLWGNPIYDWDKMKQDGYSWWMKRIRASFKFYDCLRIDHFRGFEGYYQIPGKDKTAQNGKWKKGPGVDFIDALKKTAKNKDIIAEDLGFLTPKVIKLLNYSGYPGMKVLLFAFDGGYDNPFLPHNYPENCVVYTGTHDNDTTLGWLLNANGKVLDFAAEYLGIPREYIKIICKNTPEEDKADPKCGFKESAKFCVRAMIRAAFMSKADRVIISQQDWLLLDNNARINTPATQGNNWVWRMREGSLNDELSSEIRKMTEMFGRL